MKMKRLSKFHAPALSHKHLCALHRLPDEHAGVIKKAGVAADQLVEAAVSFIESQFHVVLVASKFTIDVPRGIENTEIRMPLSPVIAASEVRVDGEKIEGWSLLRGFLLVPQGIKQASIISADLLVGWPEGQLPFLVQHAIARIVSYWHTNPAAVSVEIGPERATVSQLLSIFQHPVPIFQRFGGGV